MQYTERPAYDALLVVSFGGPERPEDVMPFLENVLRGRNVPRERMLEVAEHYDHCGGRSPLNDQNRELVAALAREFDQHGPTLPVYWGNRNWNPLLPDVLARMAADGVRRALALFTTAYSSYSSCRQYRENIAAAQAVVGPTAPQIDKLRAFYNHPLWIEASIDRVQAALATLPADARATAPLLFTAHSIPNSMAANCRYEAQLRETGRLVAEGIGRQPWQLVFQSRSGPPSQPWLEPDVCDALRQLAADGGKYAVIAPIGFLSDHMEVLYDLDVQARELADELGITLARAKTVGASPKFIALVRELVLERIEPDRVRRVCGLFEPNHDVCPVDCCLPPPPRPS